MTPVQALLFDLDGTPVDSRQYIPASVHFIQKHFKESLSSETDVSSYIGDGMRQLVQRVLPQADEQMLTEALDIFKDHYSEHCLDHTVVYPHVHETLEHFRGKPMAV